MYIRAHRPLSSKHNANYLVYSNRNRGSRGSPDIFADQLMQKEFNQQYLNTQRVEHTDKKWSSQEVGRTQSKTHM